MGSQATQSHACTLAEHHGKVVVLDFWATWCGWCLKAEPTLRSVWGRHGSNARFTMVGLSADHLPEDPIRHLREQDIPWPQAYLSREQFHAVAADYGVGGLPSFWVIGADGKVIAGNLHDPEEVARVVDEAMRNLPSEMSLGVAAEPGSGR